MSTDPRADNALFVDIATRWRRPEERHELVSVKFTEAKPSLCHDNAAAYVSQYGGAVIHGFLVVGSQEQSAVLVHAHSVVRSAEGRLLDPTLIEGLLQGQAFIEYHGTAETSWRWPSGCHKHQCPLEIQRHLLPAFQTPATMTTRATMGPVSSHSECRRRQATM
jgi:hypothetical protein